MVIVDQHVAKKEQYFLHIYVNERYHGSLMNVEILCQLVQAHDVNAF